MVWFCSRLKEKHDKDLKELENAESSVREKYAETRSKLAESDAQVRNFEAEIKQLQIELEHSKKVWKEGKEEFVEFYFNSSFLIRCATIILRNVNRFMIRLRVKCRKSTKQWKPREIRRFNKYIKGLCPFLPKNCLNPYKYLNFLNSSQGSTSDWEEGCHCWSAAEGKWKPSWTLP